MIEVARRYHFRGRHHVPGLPHPWCEPHEHDYTVEIVARGTAPVVIDTDEVDAAWARIRPLFALVEAYRPEHTTVEALAERWLADMRATIPCVHRVVVWEDDTRWGAAE
jgi:6-pyruvoyl-tetrahydropterin synthase